VGGDERPRQHRSEPAGEDEQQRGDQEEPEPAVRRRRQQRRKLSEGVSERAVEVVEPKHPVDGRPVGPCRSAELHRPVRQVEDDDERQQEGGDGTGEAAARETGRGGRRRRPTRRVYRPPVAEGTQESERQQLPEERVPGVEDERIPRLQGQQQRQRDRSREARPVADRQRRRRDAGEREKQRDDPRLARDRVQREAGERRVQLRERRPRERARVGIKGHEVPRPEQQIRDQNEPDRDPERGERPSVDAETRGHRVANAVATPHYAPRRSVGAVGRRERRRTGICPSSHRYCYMFCEVRERAKGDRLDAHPGRRDGAGRSPPLSGRL